MRERARQRSTTHGSTGSPEYVAWGNMIQRCENPNHPCFDHYGGRDIRVCTRWRKSFAAFLEDIGPRPSPAHEIDRIDNDGHYEPENVRWATRRQQMRNMRRNRPLTCGGETRSVAGWAEHLGLNYSTLGNRLAKGWSTPSALLTPLNESRRRRGGSQASAARDLLASR